MTQHAAIVLKHTFVTDTTETQRAGPDERTGPKASAKRSKGTMKTQRG